VLTVATEYQTNKSWQLFAARKSCAKAAHRFDQSVKRYFPKTTNHA
jgi:hypothetical protein